MSAAPIEHLNARLASGDVVVIDGATGTELEARGVPMDDAAWCGVANLEYAEVAREIHADSAGVRLAGSVWMPADGADVDADAPRLRPVGSRQ